MRSVIKKIISKTVVENEKWEGHWPYSFRDCPWSLHRMKLPMQWKRKRGRGELFQGYDP